MSPTVDRLALRGLELLAEAGVEMIRSGASVEY
jgi:hypothetical protein